MKKIPVYHTQGGGLAYWSNLQICWLFWETPSWMNEEPHSPVPYEWGIGCLYGLVEFDDDEI